MDFVESTGKIIGYQLENSGINMLLGPVLDLEKTKQGTYNEMLKNRSFSSYADDVITVASFYIKGLRESGMTVIGKHFPGLGGVTGNPHKEIVSFQQEANLKEHLRPYRKLRPVLHGIMTSHVTLPFLDNKKPATFNKSIIQFIRDKPFVENLLLPTLNYKKELVITDDLGMRATSNYTDFSKNNYASMVIKSIEAGHDIVMFAKVLANSEQNKPGGIHIDELIKVKEKLAQYLKRPENKEKYKISLHRIIRAKATSYKFHGGDINHFISRNMNKVLRSQRPVPDLVKGVDGFLNHDKVKKFYEKIIENSYLVLKSGYSYSIENSNGICIFTPKEHKDSYFGLVELYGNKLHISHEMHEYRKSLNEKINNIKNYITNNSCDIVFSIINSNESIDRVTNIINFLKETNNNTIRLVLLLHQTPISLPKKITNNKKITIMGAFTEHKISYNTDVKIIKGDIKPKTIDQLTIDYNNEKFNNPIGDTAEEKLLKEKQATKEKRIKEKIERKIEETKREEEKHLKEKIKSKQEEEKQAKEQQLKEEKANKIAEKKAMECLNDRLEKKDFSNSLHKNILLSLIIFMLLFVVIYLLRKTKKMARIE